VGVRDPVAHPVREEAPARVASRTHVFRMCCEGRLGYPTADCTFAGAASGRQAGRNGGQPVGGGRGSAAQRPTWPPSAFPSWSSTAARIASCPTRPPPAGCPRCWTTRAPSSSPAARTRSSGPTPTRSTRPCSTSSGTRARAAGSDGGAGSGSVGQDQGPHRAKISQHPWGGRDRKS